MNILKDKYLIDNDLFYFVKNKIDGSFLAEIDRLTESSSLEYRCFLIKKIGNSLKISYNQKYKGNYLPKLFLEIKDYLLISQQHFFASMFQDDERVGIGQKRKIITLLHRDLFLILGLIKTDIFNDQIIKKKLIDYLSFELNYHKPLEKIFKIKNNKLRSNLLKPNKSSLFYDKNNNVRQNEYLLSKKLKGAIDKISFLTDIEISYGFDEEKTYKLLSLIHKKLEKLGIKNKKDYYFSLKIKKIKRTKKDGIFIKHLNLIIIDPRSTSAIWHELGHWIEENKIEIILNKKKAKSGGAKRINQNYNKTQAKKEEIVNDLENNLIML